MNLKKNIIGTSLLKHDSGIYKTLAHASKLVVPVLSKFPITII